MRGESQQNRQAFGVILRYKDTAAALVQKHADAADMWRAALKDANAVRDDARFERDQARAEGERIYADDFDALVDYYLQLREQCGKLLKMSSSGFTSKLNQLVRDALGTETNTGSEISSLRGAQGR